MQFTREDSNEANTIVAYAEGEVRLRDHAYTSSLIVTRTEILDGWRPASANALSIADFSALIALKPEIVLLGTGNRQRIPPPALYAEFAARRIGFEVMDNRAACRTFNLLLSEYRDVAVALML
jgi:uncharacterized protein